MTPLFSIGLGMAPPVPKSDRGRRFLPPPLTKSGREFARREDEWESGVPEPD
jgi:hypothetical protein